MKEESLGALVFIASDGTGTRSLCPCNSDCSDDVGDVDVVDCNCEDN